MSTHQDHALICTAIENALYDFWHKVTIISENKASINDDLSWVMSANSDWPTRIFNAKFTTTDAIEKIVAAIEQIKLGKFPNKLVAHSIKHPIYCNYNTFSQMLSFKMLAYLRQ